MIAAPRHDMDPDPAPAPPDSVTVDEALEYAVRCQRGGEPETAAILYRRILEAAPDHPDALHFYGLLHHQCGQTSEGIALLLRSVEVAPDNAAACNNLGNMLAEQRRFADAARAYEAALAVQPGFVDALSNLGAALRRLDRLEEAEAAYRCAIAADPRHREAHDNLGRLLSRQGRIAEAIGEHARALELEPRNAETRRLLIASYAAIGEDDKALALLSDWLADEPTSPSARHLFAAISGRDVPERAGDDYVRTLFDGFAESFDRTLGRLGYRAPHLVAAALAEAGLPAGPPPAILDAGCGTGLCGPLLAGMAGRLDGVDLSPKMLDAARARDVYGRLEAVELTAFMVAHPGAYGAIVSADTLCYFGDLRTVLAAAAGALGPDGRLVFTVEKHPGPESFRLNPHGRYSHAGEHVRAALAAAGLDILGIDEAALRSERGQPVVGFVVAARKAEASRAIAG